MTPHFQLLAFIVLGFALPAIAAGEPAILPNPASIQANPGHFALTAKTPIVIPPGDGEAPVIAANIAGILERERGLKLRVVTGEPRDGAIHLKRVMEPPRTEGYRLEVTPARVTIEASAWSGLLYGGITLAQLPAPGRGAAAVPAVVVEDAPRFRWRGLMLDSARHYQSPAFIKRFLDAMAMHKLNILHWHLTDDQAWRLEIRKYPKLTSVGAWRVPAGAAAKGDIDPATGKPRLQGGFYSQKTVREIVRYAAERGIIVVPEIEMPGHASAAIAAYPQLAATPNPPREVPADWGIYPHVYNLDDATFRFLEDVLGEVAELFPGALIHIGGDEVEKAQWRDSPSGRERMKQLGLKEPALLQAYFTQRIAKILEARKRRLVGWDEILDDGLPRNSVVMSWRGIDGALAAAAQGYNTVLAAHPTLYFDNRQSAAGDEPPGRGAVITLQDVYRFEPMPEKIAPDKRRHVWGLQGQLWSEHIRTEERMAHMAFPRAAAIAELGWSQPQRREWGDFLRRLGAQLPRYDALKVPYADSAFAVRAKPSWRGDPAQAHVELSNEAGFGDIRYTTDGTEPTEKSARYAAPVAAAAGSTLKAASFDATQRLSRTRSVALKPELALRRASRELKLCSEHIALVLEDDAPVKGERAAFLVDIQNPCWIYKDAQLDGVKGIVATVGQLPFNFQIGEDVKKVKFPKPETAAGELEVRLGCDGELLARLPLAPAAASQATTPLPRAPIAPRAGRHDLCLRFAQPGLEPLWVIDTIQLVR